MIIVKGITQETDFKKDPISFRSAEKAEHLIGLSSHEITTYIISTMHFTHVVKKMEKINF